MSKLSTMLKASRKVGLGDLRYRHDGIELRDYQTLMEIASAPTGPWVNDLLHRLSAKPAKKIGYVIVHELGNLPEDGLLQLAKSPGIDPATKVGVKMILSARPKERARPPEIGDHALFMKRQFPTFRGRQSAGVI